MSSSHFSRASLPVSFTWGKWTLGIDNCSILMIIKENLFRRGVITSSALIVTVILTIKKKHIINVVNKVYENFSLYSKTIRYSFVLKFSNIKDFLHAYLSESWFILIFEGISLYTTFPNLISKI